MAAVQSDNSTQQQRHQEWYDPDITEAPPAIRQLLETYSKIPSKDVVSHINKIRERGFESNPYPCIGHYRFLSLTLISHPLYKSILERLKSSSQTRYLDLGCCFGQDLRALVSDGVPSSQLVGLDIERPLIELGYDLFLDRSTLQSEFIIADVFAGASQGPVWADLEKEEKQFDVVHASAFFHLFPHEGQVKAAEKVARLVRKDGVIVGRQSGSVKPGEFPAIKAGTTSFRHDVDTFQKMWDEVGEKTGTKWRVDGTLDMVGLTAVKKNPVEDENSRRLLFTVTREA